MEQNLISHYSSMRNYRPKGLDKERILQAVLILAICMWFLYLINNSNHRQEDDNVNTENISIKNLTSTLGRKGLAEHTTGESALENGENAGEDYEIDVNIDEDTESVLKLEDEETIVLNGKREATEAEFLRKQLYNISVDDNGEDAFTVEAFTDENGIPPDASSFISSTEPRGAEPKNLDSEYK